MSSPRFLLGVSIIAVLSGLGVAGAQTVEDYLKQVHDADPQKRVAAITILKTFPANGAVISALIEELKDNFDASRQTAAYVLGQFAADPHRVVPALIETLDDRNPMIRAAAAVALGSFGTQALPALSKLGPLLADPDVEVRRGAIQGLSGFAASSSEAQALIIGKLQDTAPYVRSRAVAALSQVGEKPRSYLPQFIAVLADQSDQVREEAAQAIGALGAAGAPAFPAMIAASRTPRYRSPYFLKIAIREIAAKQGVSPVPLLIAALNDSENSIEGRVFAAETLGEMGARAAEPDLLKASKEGPELLRKAAAFALPQVNPQRLADTSLAEWIATLASDDIFSRNRAHDALVKAGANAVPLLLPLLGNDTPDSIRTQAMSALGHIGYPAQAAVPVMTSMIAGTESIEVQKGAVLALGYIGSGSSDANSAPILETLCTALANPKLRETAASTLQNWRGKATAAVPAIQAALEGAINDHAPDNWAIIYSLSALGNIGTRAPSVVSVITPLLENLDPRVWGAAVDALGGMPTTEAVAALSKALHNPTDWMRGRVAESLGRLIAKADGRIYVAQVLPALLEHVKDPAAEVRAAVVGALGESASSAAVRPVIEAMSDSSGHVRWRATMALDNLVEHPGDTWIREAVLPVLIRAVDDSESRVAFYATVGLKTYGPAAAPALPALRRTLARGDAFLNAPIADAIKAIEAKPNP